MKTSFISIFIFVVITVVAAAGVTLAQSSSDNSAVPAPTPIPVSVQPEPVKTVNTAPAVSAPTTSQPIPSSGSFYNPPEPASYTPSNYKDPAASSYVVPEAPK